MTDSTTGVNEKINSRKDTTTVIFKILSFITQKSGAMVQPPIGTCTIAPVQKGAAAPVQHV